MVKENAAGLIGLVCGVKLDNLGLEESLDIVNESGGTLYDFLSVITNFCNGKTDLLKAMPPKHMDVTEEIEPIAENVAMYALNLIQNYERSNPFNLFLATLATLVFLPQEHKAGYVNAFNGFVEKENESPNKEGIMPAVITELLPRLTAKYQEAFGKLAKNGSTDAKYQRAAEELKKDLNQMIEYSMAKLDQNARFNPRAKDISYEECFPKNEGINLNALTPQYISGLMDNHGSAQDVLQTFGPPIGMAHRGIRDEVNTTINIWYGNELNPKKLVMDHPRGLSPKQVKFYLTLTEATRPATANFDQSTGKCRRFLLSLSG